MKHSDLQALLSAYADGELARTQREFVAGHTADCPACQIILAGYERDRHQLTSLRLAPTPADLNQATMSKIRASQGLNGLMPRFASAGVFRPALLIVTVLVVALTIGILQTSGAGPIEKAEAATAALQSYRAVELVTVTKYGETSKSEMEIRVSDQDRFQVTVKKSEGAFDVVGIGDSRYIRGSDRKSDHFHVSTGVGSFLDKVTSQAKSDDTTGLAMSTRSALEILDSLLDLEQLPDEMFDGYETLRYQGKIDWGKVGRESIATKRSIIDLWIDKADYTIRQAKVEVAVLEDTRNFPTQEWLSITSLVKYFDFNEPIEIEPPLTSSGEIQQGWSLVDIEDQEIDKRKPDDDHKRKQ